MAYKIKNKTKKEKKQINQDSFVIKKGEIMDFQGSWGSGIATMVIKREDGKIERVPCENTQTTRALDSAYGGIEAGHSFNVKNIKGKEIYYSMDDMGLVMGGFMPVEQADQELETKYLKQFKKK